MAYLIVRLKLTTIEKVVSLMNKLEKYDIVESVESHNDSRPTPLAVDAPRRCLCGEPATINDTWCEACFPDTGRR